LIQQHVVRKEEARGHPGFSRGIDQEVSEALTYLRRTGLIPWEWIADETRQAYVYAGASSIIAGLIDVLDGIQLDPWGETRAPLILCESRSLAGVLRPTAAEYGCDIAATNGQVGGFLRTDIVPLLRGGRPVFYFGDFDLAGAHIERNTGNVLTKGYTWRETGEPCEPTSWERLALTRAQVEASPELQGLVIVKQDKRFKDGGSYEAIETEALSQTVIVATLRDALDAVLPEALADVRVREQAQRDEVRAHLEAFKPGDDDGSE
jgi:hypothetical protein